MAVIKCKMCGGDIALNEEKTFGTCEYCGSTMTLPKVSDDQRAALFNRGNHFRRAGEFDKALAIYENIVREDDTDAEAHWCCALCRFGIEYVEDPNTYEYIPTCHRASFDSFLEDVDYLAALENSDGITRRQYQKDGAKIAEVQKGILATSQNEEPFDVFICYKETDDNTKERTKDSLDAQEIYYQLTNEGYRVFFSRITLEDKAGAEYEPYIFAALNSAKVMVAIGSKPEYFNAVWVKNEWSRFLALMRKDRSKLLLPCYKGMDPYDLPEQLSVLQSYDMSKIGFMQDLIRGIKKVLAKDEPAKPQPAEQPVVQQVVQSAGGTNLTAQIKRGTQALEDRDWEQASAFFDKALDIDAECAEAFWGKALAEEQCSTPDEFVKRRLSIPVTQTEELTACTKDIATVDKVASENMVPSFLSANQIRSLFSFDKRTYSSHTSAYKKRVAEEKNFWEHNRLLSRAVRYNKGDTANAISACRETIFKGLNASLERSIKDDETQRTVTVARYTAEMQKATEKAKSMRAEAENARLAVYNNACKLQASAKTIDDYNELISKQYFGHEGLKGFKDSDDRLQQCVKELHKLSAEALTDKLNKEKAKKKKVKRIVAIIIAAILLAVAAYFVITKTVIPANKYSNAVMLYESGKYEEAITAFEALDGYKDSEEQIKACKYKKALDLIEIEDFNAAYALLSEIGESDIMVDNKRDRAIAMLESGDYNAAYTLLSEIGDNDTINKNKHERAIAMLESGDYNSAYSLLREIGETDIVNSNIYERAVALMNDGNYDEAIPLFSELNGYNDSVDKIVLCNYNMALEMFDSEQYNSAFNIFNTIRYSDSAEYCKLCAKYLAQQAYDNGNLVEAVSWYITAGESKKVDEIKYEYVLSHRNNTDVTTYEYLKELKAKEYRNSSSIYSELYTVHLYILVNDDKDNTTSNPSSLKYILVNHDYYLHYLVTGGYPGQVIDLSISYEAKVNGSWVNIDNGSYAHKQKNINLGVWGWTYAQASYIKGSSWYIRTTVKTNTGEQAQTVTYYYGYDRP